MEVGVDFVVLLGVFGLVDVAVALDDARRDQVAFGALFLPSNFEDAAILMIAVFVIVKDHAIVLISKPCGYVLDLPIKDGAATDSE